MKTTQTTTITKTIPKQQPKPQRQTRRKAKQSNVMTKIVNTTANVATGSIIKSGLGAKLTSSGNITRIVHREFISDVSSTASGFSTVNFAINPGNATAFPWLSAIAANYESYTFKKLCYRYVPLCATSTPGRVTMAIDFDARDSIPTTKAVLSQYQGAIATPVWQQALYTAQSFNLTKFAKQRYVNGATVPTSSDVKTYHVGQFILATSNTPSTATSLGELWVEYDVEFQTPQIATVTASALNEERQTISGGAQRVRLSIVDKLPVFDTSFSDEIHNLLGKTQDYTIGNISSRKFTIMLNKFINHPVLYLIRYSGLLRFVRVTTTTAGFSPSLRQRGTSNAVAGFSSIDLTSDLGLGFTDPIRATGLESKFLSFIAFPSAFSTASDPNNVASQLQFAYDLTGGSAVEYLRNAVDIQSFALPPMQNNDTSSIIFGANGATMEGTAFSSHSDVDTAGWLTLANQLSSYASSTTFRQVYGPSGDIKLLPLAEAPVSQSSSETIRPTPSPDVNAMLQDVIKLLKDKVALREDVIEE